MITVGTRGSQLARAQTDEAVRLMQARRPEIQFEVRVLQTSGDRNRSAPLSVIGGKGVFARELELALVDGTIDIAVHSLKDLPPRLEPGLCLAAVPARGDPRDALVARDGLSLETLPAGCTVGTGSARRRALIGARRPDLTVVDVRGNVDTRIAKVHRREVDAVVLAAAGLSRLGRLAEACQIFTPDVMTPAPGQGALGIEIRENDATAREVAGPVDDPDSRACAEAERAFLARLGAGCSLPVGAFAQVLGDTIQIRGLIASADTHEQVQGCLAGPRVEAAAWGERLATQLLAEGGSRWLSKGG